MRILHINSYYVGSAFYQNLFEAQRRQGLELSVVVPAPKETDASKLKLAPYADLRLNHHRRDRLFFHLKHGKIWRDIRDHVDVSKVDMVHAHSLFSNGYIARKLYRQYGLPYTVAVRNTDINVFFKRMVHLRSMGVSILADAKRIVFLSAPYRDLLIQRYVPSALRAAILEKSVILPNGLDAFWLEHKGEPKRLDVSRPLRLVYAGVIDANKNALATCKAIRLLEKEGIAAELTVVGRVVDEAVRAQLDAYPFVHRLAPCPKEELIRVYREGDIFVMPSLKETFGLVYAEAMSQGLPVLYSKGQGFDQQFADGVVGYAVAARQPADIAQKIRRVIEGYDALSISCLAKAEVFDWERIAKAYAALYQEAAVSQQA